MLVIVTHPYSGKVTSVGVDQLFSAFVGAPFLVLPYFAGRRRWCLLIGFWGRGGGRGMYVSDIDCVGRRHPFCQRKGQTNTK